MMCPENVEASDIVKLLRELSVELGDSTCRELADWSEYHGAPVLRVAFLAIEALSKQKAEIKGQYLDLYKKLPLNLIIDQKRWRPGAADR